MRKTKILTGFLQLLKKIVYTIPGLTAIYFLSALFLSYLPAVPDDGNCEPDKTIYITTNGVHLDIVLPFENM